MEDAKKRDYETADRILSDGKAIWFRERIAHALCMERELAARPKVEPGPDPIRPWYYPSADESKRA